MFPDNLKETVRERIGHGDFLRNKSNHFIAFFRYVAGSLLRPHPAELGAGLLFQEEGRAERLSNLIRLSYLIVWLTASTVYARDNFPEFNRINFALGGSWLLGALMLHTWLLKSPYHFTLKYVSTTFDMLASTVLVLSYAVTAGSVFAFKMPIFMNYFCCLGLAALRFHRRLAIYAATLAAGMYLALWLWLDARGIAYGDSLQHAYAGRLHPKFLADQAVYLLVFGFLTIVVAFNVRRLVTLRVAEGERAAREEERALMATGLAHEIRNPLGGICGAAQLLREQGGWDNRYTDLILSDARRLNGVVEGFLNYARPFTARPERVDCAGLVRDFCREQNRLHPDAQLECRGGLSAEWVYTDAGAVRQILLNLVQNARRFQVAGRPVRVSLEVRSGMTAICVEDDGPGVPAAGRTRLFEPFHTGTAKGTGLGLALSRRMARTLGGDLTYEPMLPGARFVLVPGPPAVAVP